MKCPLTGCPDAQLEPDYPENQREINRFYYMSQARDEIMAFLSDDEYKKYFPDEISSFEAGMAFVIQQERERLDGEFY